MDKQPTSNEKIVEDLIGDLNKNREMARLNIYGLLKAYETENVDDIIKQSKRMFDKYPGLREEIEVKLDKLIESKEDELKVRVGEIDSQQKLSNIINKLNIIRDSFLNMKE